VAHYHEERNHQGKQNRLLFSLPNRGTFLGTDTWRKAWVEAQKSRIPFPTFLAHQFTAQMGTLRYIPPPLYTMKEVRSDDNNLPLYHLALFSRNPRAYEFWDDVLKYSTDQTSFGF
jgi:hypothetical protein